MDNIESSITTPDGIADCMIELQNSDTIYYSVTVLYPHIVNGFSRSEVHCHNMLHNASDGRYYFDIDDDIHPKIKQLEETISDVIAGKRQ